MNDIYVEEQTGLRYCSLCHTPREAFYPNGLEIFGRRTHPVLCRCQREAYEKKQKEQEERERQERTAQLRRSAFRDIPAESWRFSAVPMTPQLEKARHYVDHWEELREQGTGLLLFGAVGTGKSYAAGCIANALLDRGVSVRLAGLSDVVGRLQGLGGEERSRYLRELLDPDLLILDDLGSERSTSFGREQVFDVVNKRTLSGKPLIVTTNLELHALQHAEDLQERRIYDRILEVCVPLQFTGESFRRAHAADRLRQAAALLRD